MLLGVEGRGRKIDAVQAIFLVAQKRVRHSRTNRKRDTHPKGGDTRLYAWLRSCVARCEPEASIFPKKFQGMYAHMASNTAGTVRSNTGMDNDLAVRIPIEVPPPWGLEALGHAMTTDAPCMMPTLRV